MNDELTIVICSFKATKEFKFCLHQLALFGLTNVLIYENSPDDYKDNRKLLDEYDIPYIDNPNGSHALTMNKALNEVKTKYALLLDSDCFIMRDITSYFDFVKTHNIQLYGDIQGDRGGFHIHKRVHPWFCFVDVDFIKKHSIQFVDFERIALSHSESFVENGRFDEQRDRNGFYYDAGSSMLEDVIGNGGLVAEIGELNIPYLHKEGSSWQPDSKVYSNLAMFKDAQYTSLISSMNPDNLTKFKR